MPSPERSASKRIADDVHWVDYKESLVVTQTPTDAVRKAVFVSRLPSEMLAEQDLATCRDL